MIPIFPGFPDSDPQPSTLGLGFDPSAIQPESGFKPILEQGGGLPTLAFGVLDGVGRPFAEDHHHQILLDSLDDDLDEVATEEDDISRRSGISRNEDQVFKHSEVQKELTNSKIEVTNSEKG